MNATKLQYKKDNKKVELGNHTWADKKLKKDQINIYKHTLDFSKHLEIHRA